MADELSPISRKLVLDTTDFKTGISQINRDIRVLETSFKASAAGLQDWSRDATGLESRIRTLSSQIEDQRLKVALLAREHQRVAEAEGADSKAAQDLQIKLNLATGTLNKMELELRQDNEALLEVRGSSEMVSKAIGVGVAGAAIVAQGALAGLRLMARGLVLEFQAIAKVIQTELAVAFGVLKVGVGAIVGLGAAALIATAAVGGLTLTAATAADQLGELADKTGISVRELQQLRFIGTVVGTDLDSITMAAARLVRSMSSAEKGTGAQADAFKQLKIRVKDADGTLRDSRVVFGEVLDKLRAIQDPTERDALAMALFGKSAQELNPLILLGSKGMETLADRADKLGAIVDNKTIVALGNLRDQFDELKLGAQGVGTTILGAFAPFWSGVLDNAQGVLERLNRVVKDSNGDFGLLAGGIGSLFSSVIQSIADSAPQMVQGGTVIVESLAKAIIDALPAMLKAGRTIIVNLSDAILQALPEIEKAAPDLINLFATALLNVLPLLFTVGSSILLTLVNVIGQSLPGLLPRMADTGLQIIKQLLAGIQKAFPVLVDLAPKIITTLIGFLKENLTSLIEVGIPLITTLIDAIVPALPLLVDAALKILIALTNAIAAQLPVLVPVIVQVVVQIVEILARNAPLLIQAATALMIGLIQGFREAAPQFYALAPELLSVLVQAFLASLYLLLVAGVQLLAAVAQGWKSMIATYVPAMVNAVVDQIRKSVAGAFSAMYNIGKQLLEGLWQGIQDRWSDMVDGIIGFFQDLIARLQGLLQISSPSKVFEKMGKNVAAGFGLGFLGDMEGVQRQAMAAMRGFTSGAQAGAGVGSSTTSNNQSFDFFAPVIIQGNTTPDSLGAALKARRF